MYPKIVIPARYLTRHLTDTRKFVFKGYLAVTLLMHENSDLLRLVVNSIRKDLDENNEVNNCLALHAIANVGSNEMAEALAEDVHRLLISPYAYQRVCSWSGLTLTPGRRRTSCGRRLL